MTKIVKGPAAGPSSGNAGGESGLGGLLGGLLGGGGLGSILGGALGGGIPAGRGTGGALGGGITSLIPALLPALLAMLSSRVSASSTGMHQLVSGMQANGLGDVAQSWVGGGPNQPITTDQVQHVLTREQLSELSAKSGLPEEQVKTGLAAVLPDVVSHLTPDGVLPEPAQVQSSATNLQQLLAGIIGAGTGTGPTAR